MNALPASALSGLLWGGLAAFLGHKAIPLGIYAAPAGMVVGLLVFLASRPLYRKSFGWLVPTAVVTLFFATALFGLCVGTIDVMLCANTSRATLEVLVQNMLAYLWGLVCVPVCWALFPLALLNHAWIRSLARRETVAPVEAGPPGRA